MSGSSPSARGSCQTSAPPAARLAERSRASANLGFVQSPPTRACASVGSPSELPRAYRETHSTPAEMNTSPSPALMAWKAIRVVCSDEEQCRVTVAPGRWSYPSRMATAGQAAAEVEVVDLARIESGHLVHGRRDDGGGEVVGTDLT